MDVNLLNYDIVIASQQTVTLNSPDCKFDSNTPDCNRNKDHIQLRTDFTHILQLQPLDEFSVYTRNGCNNQHQLHSEPYHHGSIFKNANLERCTLLVAQEQQQVQ